jgi:hypothetical protein
VRKVACAALDLAARTTTRSTTLARGARLAVAYVPARTAAVMLVRPW